MSVLIMTGTIQPKQGARELARTDVGARIEDYRTALAHYLRQLRAGRLSALIVAENSGYGMDPYTSMMSVSGASEKVELISYDALQPPANPGSGVNASFCGKPLGGLPCLRTAVTAMSGSDGSVHRSEPDRDPERQRGAERPDPALPQPPDAFLSTSAWPDSPAASWSDHRPDPQPPKRDQHRRAGVAGHDRRRRLSRSQTEASAESYPGFSRGTRHRQRLLRRPALPRQVLCAVTGPSDAASVWI